MKTGIVKSGTLAAALLSGVLVFDVQILFGVQVLFGVQAANAQTSTPAATATRPAKTPPDQTSIPGGGPPATATQTTGEASRNPTTKQMNEDEKSKVDSKGK